MTMMRTKIERLGDTQLRLDVEVPAEVLKTAFDNTLQLMGRELNIAGFRPGKVPPQAVLARLGREHVTAETVRIHMDDWYRAAVIASGIRPVKQPEVDMPDDIQAGDFAFSATIEVAPKPKLPELKNMEVDKPRLPDVEKYVNQVVEANLRGVGKLVDTGKPAELENEVVVDFNCKADGEEITGASASGYQARLGDGRLLTELEEAIIGAEAGAEIEVPVTFPADHPMAQLAGRDATFHLKVIDVQTLELPELTDDIAADVSEFDTKKEFLDDIRGTIVERLENEVKGMFRGNAVAKLAEVAELNEPESLVQSRQQEMYAGMKEQLQQSGMTVEQYLDRSGKDSTELFEEIGESARDDLRRELCLLALAEDAGIEISEDDLRAEVKEHAEAGGHDAAEAMQQILDSGRADMLRGELLIQRTIDHLIENVKAVEVDPPSEDGDDE